MGRLVDGGSDHATLLRALAIVRRTVPARLAIPWATARAATTLLALRDRLGLADAVTLPGFDPYPVRWLAEADLFVLSRRCRRGSVT